jgi:16S rRNA (guanine527-N7)-methyltransferase
VASPEAVGRSVVAADVSRETLARLDILESALRRWQSTFNLVGPATLDHFWTRHALDSLQLLDLAPPTALNWTDIGSGAGFPGLVLAAALAERPGALVHLIEPNQKRAAFLRETGRAMGAPICVHALKVEDAPFASCDIVTARAVAPLVDLLGMAERYLSAGAIGLFLKGQDVVSELTEASRCWSIGSEMTPSRSDLRGFVLTVREARRDHTQTPHPGRGQPEGRRR